jgi:hypothetical protein
VDEMSMLQMSPRLSNALNAAGGLAERCLPILLAVVLFGQLFFAAFKFYFGIVHIGKVCWIAIALMVPFLIYRYRRTTHITSMDVGFAAFMGMIVLSYLIRGAGAPFQFYYNIGFFCILPYAAARLLACAQLSRFFSTIMMLGGVAIPLVLIAFLQLPPEIYFSDRPYLFEIASVTGLVRGYSYHFLTVCIGAWMLLKYAKLLAPTTYATHRTARNWLVFLALAMLAMWLMVRLGLRSGVVSLVFTVFMMICVANWQVYRLRVALLLSLMIALLVAIYVQPPERVRLILQMMKLTDVMHYFDYDNVGGEYPLNWACMVAGDSIATRIQYLHTALQLFVDSPVFGMGAGQYGHHYCDSTSDYVSPHSYAAHVGVELGIAGFVMVLLWMGRVCASAVMLFKRVNAADKLHLWYISSLWVFFFLWAQMNGNYFTDFHLYAMTGLLTGVIAQRQQRQVPYEN